MSPAQITTALNAHLPAIFIAVNPKSVRELLTRAGRPYQARLDEILAAMNESRAANQDVTVREWTFNHAGRVVTLVYGRTRADQYGIPKLRMLAISLEAAAAEAPDSVLEPFLRQLKEAIGETGARADETLQALTGTTLKWDPAG